jgi:SAM-dependent methyltransferase
MIHMAQAPSESGVQRQYVSKFGNSRAPPSASEEYAHIAEEYAASKRIPPRLMVERPTLIALLGDVAGHSVLDLACGDGTYSRMAAELGATRVVGVDVSEAMIHLAREAAGKAAGGGGAGHGPGLAGTPHQCDESSGCSITYMVADALKLQEQAPKLVARGPNAGFDVVLCAYLFNYARTAAELAAMARSAFACTRPGGRCVGMNDNPHTKYDIKLLEDFAVGRVLESRLEDGGDSEGQAEAEGRSKVAAPALRQGGHAGGSDRQSAGEAGEDPTAAMPTDGTPVRILLRNNDGREFCFHNYYWSPAAYERAFLDAGFVGFQWRQCQLAAGATPDEATHWQCFLRNCPLIGFEAVRPA